MGLEELKPEEHALLELMKEYNETDYMLGSEVHELDEQISKLMDERDMLAKPFQDKLAELEAKIRIPMLAYQHTFISSYGTVTYRKGAVRRTYNADALDSICAVDEYVKMLIWAHRKETIGDPSIQINLSEA